MRAEGRDALAGRLGALLAFDPRIAEKRMFGGICFLLDGRILVCARGKGGLLVQCGAEAAAAAVREPDAAPMVMRGRPAANFIIVDEGSLETDDDLRRWIVMAERYLAGKE